eukprot:4844125-Amphidinium_carterae.1
MLQMVAAPAVACGRGRGGLSWDWLIASICGQLFRGFNVVKDLGLNGAQCAFAVGVGDKDQPLTRRCTPDVSSSVVRLGSLGSLSFKINGAFFMFQFGNYY